MPNMKLGLNRDLNTETKKCGCALWTAALKLKANSHISNQIHKAAMKEQKKEPAITPTPSSPPAPATTSLDINKALIVMGAVLAWKH